MSNELLDNIERIHTTAGGEERIRRNLVLGPEEEPVSFCREVIRAVDCRIYRRGKNWYAETGGIRITVNGSSYTIITAHMRK